VKVNYSLPYNVQDLAKTLDGGEQMDCILLDFSKALDKVPHKHLLSKLVFNMV